MNPRLDRLIQLLQIKQNVTEKAHVELLKAQEQFEHNKGKHAQLVGYRQEYIQQLESLGSKGGYVGHLRNRIDFISHLDTALIQLNTHLSHLAKFRMKAELNYKQAKISEEGVSKLIDRVKKAEQGKLQRIEQKEIDEYAQKQWYSTNNDKHNDDDK